MANEQRTVTSKCLLLQSGQNQYAEEVWQHFLQKYDSETVMPTSKVHYLSSFQSVLFCLDNVPLAYGKEQLKDVVLELLITQPKKCVTELKAHLEKMTSLQAIDFGPNTRKGDESGNFLLCSSSKVSVRRTNSFDSSNQTYQQHINAVLHFH